MTKLEKQMLEVINSRKKDYIDYTEFCVLLPYLKDGIELNVGKWVIQKLGMNYLLVRKIFKFTQTMLAMKALRTFSCSKESFIDSIIDFVNYRNLANNSFRKLSTRDEGVKIAFDENIFNPLLNIDNTKIDDIKYLLKPEFVKWVDSFYTEEEMPY